MAGSRCKRCDLPRLETLSARTRSPFPLMHEPRAPEPGGCMLAALCDPHSGFRNRWRVRAAKDRPDRRGCPFVRAPAGRPGRLHVRAIPSISPRDRRCAFSCRLPVFLASCFPRLSAPRWRPRRSDSSLLASFLRHALAPSRQRQLPFSPRSSAPRWRPRGSDSSPSRFVPSPRVGALAAATAPLLASKGEPSQLEASMLLWWLGRTLRSAS